MFYSQAFKGRATLSHSKNYIPTPVIYELAQSAADREQSEFYDQVKPADFPEGILRYRNNQAAQSVGLESLSDDEWKKHFWQFSPLPENIKTPLALRYHGHQFQHYNPELGDGRGFLFAQMKSQSGKILDLGTKGSGQTPYSRSGDGRLTLKGAIREALATEMLPLIGVETSKTFSIFETGEPLRRNDEPSPTRSAVLVRLSHSHIRFGTFQRLAFFEKHTDIEKLIQYSCKNYFPNLTPNAENFFAEVTARTAKLASEWMVGGFVHGVLNTDNMNITGESFDYGPYRFLPHYDPNFTAAYFDRSGLYCYGRQASACLWNLAQLAKAIESQIEFKALEKHLENFSEQFADNCAKKLLSRLGLKEKTEEDSQKLIQSFFGFAEESQGLYEQTVFDLYGGAKPERLEKSPLKIQYQLDSAKTLLQEIEKHEVENPGQLNSEYYRGSICESLLYSEIEEIWKEIDTKNDWTLFNQKIERVKKIKAECVF
ncbi:MAG: protein adenylyltransferase SelO family protein [Pseudobdellovibrionaceae bacterium]